MITIPLDNTNLKPFYIQIYEYIRKEILNGNIAAEEKLPSARNLAANLNVSRSTVDTWTPAQDRDILQTTLRI